MPFTRATHKSGATLRDQFKHGGRYKHEVVAALGEVFKVHAHESREEALKQEREEHWKGNNAADEVAKRVRPKL